MDTDAQAEDRTRGNATVEGIKEFSSSFRGREINKPAMQPPRVKLHYARAGRVMRVDMCERSKKLQNYAPWEWISVEERSWARA